MVIIEEKFSELKKIDFKKSIITIGVFDGVHKGHLKLFSKFSEVSYKNLNKIIISFSPHPRSVVESEVIDGGYILTPPHEKMRLIKKVYPFDYMIIIRFTEKFSKISAENFIEQLVSLYSPEHFIVGDGHRFGFNREGDFDLLKKLGNKLNYKAHLVDSLKINSLNVRSTFIRECLRNNNLETANNFLGWDFQVDFRVITGNRIGRQIDFPTINLASIHSNQILPQKGVYYVRIEIEGKQFYGMCNIGLRPTLTNDKEETTEVHIFGINKKVVLYDKEVKVVFLKFIRTEKKFNNKKELIEQLKKDKRVCLSFV